MVSYSHFRKNIIKSINESSTAKLPVHQITLFAVAKLINTKTVTWSANSM